MPSPIQNQATELLQQRASATAATALGETETAISEAMELAIEKILEAVENFAPEGREQLLHGYTNISGADYRQGVETLYGGADAASHSDWSNRTGTVLDQLFGSKLHAALCHIEEHSGVKQSSATTILGAAVPVVFGMMNEQHADDHSDQDITEDRNHHIGKLSDPEPEILLPESIESLDESEVYITNTAKLEEPRNFATDPLGTITDANILPLSVVDNTRVVSEYSKSEHAQSLYNSSENDASEPSLVANPEPISSNNWLLYLLIATILGLAIWWFTK